MFESHRILCYFEKFEPTEPESGREGVFGVHSTLKLWGENYILCTSLDALRKKLFDLGTKRLGCLVILDHITLEIATLIDSSKARCEVLLVTDDQLTSQESAKAGRVVSHYLNVSQGHLATTALISAVKKSMSRDLFGVEKYLTYGTPVHFFALSRSEERAWFVETLTDFVAGLEGIIPSGAREFGRKAGEVLDECLMNAIWDANPSRSLRDRSVPVFLKPNEAVRVEWGMDGSLLALSVTDPFGTLKKEDMAKFQEEVVGSRTKKQITINRTGPGAGIGLHMVLRRVSGLVINLNPGVATEFIALFDITRSPRFLSKGPKTFHFFST